MSVTKHRSHSWDITLGKWKVWNVQIDILYLCQAAKACKHRLIKTLKSSFCNYQTIRACLKCRKLDWMLETFVICTLFLGECTFGFGLAYWHPKSWEEFVTNRKAAVALCALLQSSYRKRDPCISEEQSSLLLMPNVGQAGWWA